MNGERAGVRNITLYAVEKTITNCYGRKWKCKFCKKNVLKSYKNDEEKGKKRKRKRGENGDRLYYQER